MATPVRGAMKPNGGMNTNKQYGKPSDALAGRSLVMAADEDTTGWRNGNTVKRPYLEVSRVNTGSVL